MSREELEKQFVQKEFVNYVDHRSIIEILESMFQVFLTYLIAIVITIIAKRYAQGASGARYYTVILMALAVTFIIAICGYLIFLIKAKSRKGCSYLYVFWESIFCDIGCIVSCFAMLHFSKELFNMKYDMRLPIIVLSVTIVVSMAISFIVDNRALKKGKVPIQIDDSKIPSGAVLFAIVSLLLRYTPVSIAGKVCFIGAEILGVMGGAGLAREIYRLYLIKKNNLKAEFGYITKNTPDSENNKAE